MPNTSKWLSPKHLPLCIGLRLLQKLISLFLFFCLFCFETGSIYGALVVVGLASNSQRFTCLCPLSAGVKECTTMPCHLIIVYGPVVVGAVNAIESRLHLGDGPLDIPTGIILTMLVEIGRSAHCGWYSSLAGTLDCIGR